MPLKANHRRHERHRNSGKILRPRTSPGFQQLSARQSVQSALNVEDEAVAEDEPEEHIELLEYEWPDLPPIPTMKDAVGRKRVSQGISYLLPVDKGRNSINNRFRTDLRAMFQEPYASDDLQYDDNRVKLSAKVHFLSNTADTKWKPNLLTTIPTQLNADCESARKLYVHSAPSGGVASRTNGIDPTKLRKRSNLFLPVKQSKAQVSPEIVKLREEAAEIIKQGLTYNDEEGEEGKNGMMKLTDHQHHNPYDARKSIVKTDAQGHLLTTFGGSALHDSMGTAALNARLQGVRINQEKYNNYEELRHAIPPKPQIPSDINSPFLTTEDNQRIWEWLHHGEAMSGFDYFLSVCG